MIQYCVICEHASGNGTTRVVGPFTDRDEAIDWAQFMRAGNGSWNYTPDVLMAPTPITTPS